MGAPRAARSSGGIAKRPRTARERARDANGASSTGARNRARAMTNDGVAVGARRGAATGAAATRGLTLRDVEGENPSATLATSATPRTRSKETETALVDGERLRDAREGDSPEDSSEERALDGASRAPRDAVSRDGGEMVAARNSHSNSHSETLASPSRERAPIGAAAARATATQRRGPPAKAPPITADQIELLDVAQRKKVLARWNARVRGLKSRAADIAHQFPTSSMVLYCSKPLRLERKGTWCVRFPSCTRGVVVMKTDCLRARARFLDAGRKRSFG
jgi:hypothetical protein